MYKVKDEIFYHIQRMETTDPWKVGDIKDFENEVNLQENYNEASHFVIRDPITGGMVCLSTVMSEMSFFLKNGVKNINWYHYDVNKAFEECRLALNFYLNIINELILEEERVKHFPELPSRRYGLWLIENDLNALRFFWNKLTSYNAPLKNPKILKVRASGIVHRGNCFYLMYGTNSIENFRKNAYAYWSGKPGCELYNEVLFKGTVEVMAIINPEELGFNQKVFSNIIEPYEPVKHIWTAVLKGNTLNWAHGIPHSISVERTGLFLADKNGADKAIVSLFALFHDFGRQKDGQDQGHGQRGADFAKSRQNELGLTDEQFEKLYYACYWHTDKKLTDDLTIGTCWDADRLDLPRVGIIPQIEYLNTAAAKEILQKSFIK